MESLVSRGFRAAPARLIVDEVGEALARRWGKHMLYGALWCAGGLIITIATYQAASGGGTYVVAWGAIVFGLVDFVRGLAGWSKFKG